MQIKLLIKIEGEHIGTGLEVVGADKETPVSNMLILIGALENAKQQFIKKLETKGEIRGTE